MRNRDDWQRNFVDLKDEIIDAFSIIADNYEMYQDLSVKHKAVTEKLEDVKKRKFEQD